MGNKGLMQPSVCVPQELENQYCPSRWVIRRGAEETLKMYSHLGDKGTGGRLHGCRGWTLAGGNGSDCREQGEALRAIPKVQALGKPCPLRATQEPSLQDSWNQKMPLHAMIQLYSVLSQPCPGTSGDGPQWRGEAE